MAIMSQIISWIHFGDLHITGPDDQNYRDLLQLVEEANRSMRSGIAFALLPGDNADDGEEDEYQLVHAAIARCKFPVHAIAGDHDVAAGSLDLFRKYLSDSPYRSVTHGGYHFVFLNSVTEWQPPIFGLGALQMASLRDDLHSAGARDERVIVFMHAYPSEHGADADELRELFRQHAVLLVEMGHTHYNELANDGKIIYAATRSTGQIEEGPPGFSVTTLDDGIVSWKFKPIGEWPLVMITTPSDERLMPDSAQPARGLIPVRARVWGDRINRVSMSIHNGEAQEMEPLDDVTWSTLLDSARFPNGSHPLTVHVETEDGEIAQDRITIRVDQRSDYKPPRRRTIRAIDYENVLGEWPEKHILGTQLGPNENGRKWPPRKERQAR
jgi:Icc protein